MTMVHTHRARISQTQCCRIAKGIIYVHIMSYLLCIFIYQYQSKLVNNVVNDVVRLLIKIKIIVFIVRVPAQNK